MPSELSGKFGAHVRSLRRLRGITQDDLAERSELSVDSIRRIERGAFSPSLDSVGKLSAGLDVSLATLFAPFERDRARRDEVRELSDFLAGRPIREVRMVLRVVRAMLEER